MPKKSIFRQPGSQHFQLVHRSQRDPLIHDPDANQQVLKPIDRGKSRADPDLSPDSDDSPSKFGEAALYGIYYDDSEYDYLQHLRAVGVQEEGVDSVLIEATPSSSHLKPRNKSSHRIQLKDLPPDVLASTSELPRTYESQQDIPESISGFQPDMDPHLRQVLEALDDDAFVDDEASDDFFGELVAEGERHGDEGVDFEFYDDGIEEDQPSGSVDADSWEARFAAFKKNQHSDADSRSADEFASEDGDTVSGLPRISVIGGKGKKRRKGTSDASGYSMSSSSMYRNDALQTLDERFDQMMLKQYSQDLDDADENDDEDDDDDSAPELITTREDFDSMMNEFLNDYEILGRKMKPKLDGDTGVEKLDTLRRAMGQDDPRILLEDADGVHDEHDDVLMPLDIDDRKDRWDCETILTTYSNLENHPRLIRARDTKAVPKIKLDPKTGFPVVADRAPNRPAAPKDSDTSSEDERAAQPRRATIARPRNETPEEKRLRKSAVKAERQTKRVEKKALKEEFGAEAKAQMKNIKSKEQKLKKL